jgi:oligopeptide transport system ATP-binding protein
VTATGLELAGITTRFGPLTLVDDVSLSVIPGKTLAVVGESGCGKTMTFLSALGLAPPPGRMVAGHVFFEGQDLAGLERERLRAIRGSRVSMVFQDPLTALNPVFTIGEQILEVIRAHLPISRRAARAMALDVLARVQIPDPAARFDSYPHQLSGGMRQRALIAMAIVLGPSILIADEPTTALDVTVQAQILDLLDGLRRERGMGLVLITHDLGLVAKYAHNVAVMYAGRVVERGTVEQIFAAVGHPYTRALLRSVPRLDAKIEDDLPVIGGQPPLPGDLPEGCAFEPRCPTSHGRNDCRSIRPALLPAGDHLAACHHRDEVF